MPFLLTQKLDSQAVAAAGLLTFDVRDAADSVKSLTKTMTQK